MFHVGKDSVSRAKKKEVCIFFSSKASSILSKDSIQKIIPPNKLGALTEPIRCMHGVRLVEIQLCLPLAIVH